MESSDESVWLSRMSILPFPSLYEEYPTTVIISFESTTGRDNVLSMGVGANIGEKRASGMEASTSIPS